MSKSRHDGRHISTYPRRRHVDLGSRTGLVLATSDVDEAIQAVLLFCLHLLASEAIC